jgi:hypothetical protein
MTGSIGLRMLASDRLLYENKISKIIDFIKSGNLVALYDSRVCKVFYTALIDQSRPGASLGEVNVVYVNCSRQSIFLAPDVWETFVASRIKNVRQLGLGSKIRELILDQQYVPHKTYISLGRR